jgi:hypothetical protein
MKGGERRRPATGFAAVRPSSAFVVFRNVIVATGRLTTQRDPDSRGIGAPSLRQD